MMSVYRELKDGEFDTPGLDVHLVRCASCRQALARDAFIGDQLRTLPVIEPPPDMHAKLMRALASEHLQFMQKAAPGTVSTPEFLKPYLHEHAQSTHQSNLFSAFSTAENGPLVILGSSPAWIVWLQYDNSVAQQYRNVPNVTQHLNVASWSVRYLSLT